MHVNADRIGSKIILVVYVVHGDFRFERHLKRTCSVFGIQPPTTPPPVPRACACVWDQTPKDQKPKISTKKTSRHKKVRGVYTYNTRVISTYTHIHYTQYKHMRLGRSIYNVYVFFLFKNTSTNTHLGRYVYTHPKTKNILT